MNTGTGTSYGVNINDLALYVRATCDHDICRGTEEYEHGELEAVLHQPIEAIPPAHNPTVLSLEHCDRLRDVADRNPQVRKRKRTSHSCIRLSLWQRCDLGTKLLLGFSGSLATSIVFLLI